MLLKESRNVYDSIIRWVFARESMQRWLLYSQKLNFLPYCLSPFAFPAFEDKIFAFWDDVVKWGWRNESQGQLTRHAGLACQVVEQQNAKFRRQKNTLHTGLTQTIHTNTTYVVTFHNTSVLVICPEKAQLNWGIRRISMPG